MTLLRRACMLFTMALSLSVIYAVRQPPVKAQAILRLRSIPAGGGGSLVQFKTCTTTVTLSGGVITQASVQTAVTNASNDDVICLPAGTGSWSTILTINSSTSRTKMVTIQGAGIGTSAGDAAATVITANNSTNKLSRSGVGGSGECCPIFGVFENNTLNGFELSNIRFVQGTVWNGTTLGSQENVWGFMLAGNGDSTTTVAKHFRVHHLWIEYNPTSDGNEGLNGSVINFGRLGGINTSDATLDLAHTYILGVVDHNTFHGGGSFQCIDQIPVSGRNYSPPTGGADVSEGDVSGTLAWETALSAHQNSTFNVFFEDNTVYATGWNNSNACIDTEAGGTWIVRHNTFTNNWIGGHGNDQDHGVKWEEIYDNTFIIDSSGGSPSSATSLRSGTGVYYNNRFCGAAYTCGLSITGSNNWTSPQLELQYYRAIIDNDWRGPLKNGINCRGSSLTIAEAANTLNTLGCDNFDHVSPAVDAGWLAGEQPGSKKGSSQPTWVWGYNYASEPVVAWANYLGSGSSTKAILSTTTSSSDHTSDYVQARREYISEDGTTADCTAHMGEAVCLAWWDSTNHKKLGYTAYTYPHPRTTN